MLYNDWRTANRLTLNSSKTEFLFIGLNNNYLKCMTPLSLQPTLLTTLALSVTNTLPSQTGSLHFLNLAAITFVNFSVSACTLTSKQPTPLPRPSSILIHSKLDYCNSLYHNLLNCQLDRLQQIQNSLAHAVVKALKSTHITPIFKYLHWLNFNKHIKYKLFVNYKVLTISQPSYLISLQPPPCSTHSSSVVTLSCPPTISSLKITDRSFRHSSPRLWNRLPDSSNLKSNLKTIYKAPVSGAESEVLGYRYARRHRLLRISQF